MSQPVDNSQLTKELRLQGDLRISVVYLGSRLSDEYYEYVDLIEQAYTLKLRSTSESQVKKKYSASPLSYPFKFSETGIRNFVKVLKVNDSVVSESIHVMDFPNIPLNEQDQYEVGELEPLLLKEKFVAFQIKEIEGVEVRKFPTFVVLNFDFSKDKITSLSAYQDAAENFLTKIKKFGELKELQKVLEIDRSVIKWSNRPIVVFATMSDFGFYNIDMYNRYFAGKDSDQKRNDFLSDISLREHGKKLDEMNGAVQFFDNIIHEYDDFTVWRFYYGYNPPLFDSEYIGAGEFGMGNRANLKRILKSVNFIHAVLPILLERILAIDVDLSGKLRILKQDKLNFFDSFSRSELSQFHQKLSDALRSSEEIKTMLFRMEEAKNGLLDYQRFMRDPFELPLEDPNVVITEDTYKKSIEGFHKLLHYQKRFNLDNDYFKLGEIQISFNEALDRVERNLKEYISVISSAQEVLTTKQNLQEGRKNTVLSIIVPAGGALFFGLLVYWFPGAFERLLNAGEWVFRRIFQSK